ncbi:MAG: hypothetical protein QOF51_2175 [Chloroflexota bacterium]|nr:hypothetical protein [Chloroflexota bacterium]
MIGALASAVRGLRLGGPGARPARLARHSMRSKLTGTMALVALLAVGALTATQTYFEFSRLRSAAALQDLTVARLASTNVDTLLSQTVQELNTLAANPQLVAGVIAHDDAAMNAAMEAMIPADPDLTVLAVLDTSGVFWASSNKSKGALGLDYSDQPHVSMPLQGAPLGMTAARLGLTTGLPVVPLGVPIRGPDGQVIGVLQGSLSLAHLSEQLKEIRVSDSGYVGLLAADGMVLADRDISLILNQLPAPSVAVNAALQGQSGVQEDAVGADGLAMISAAEPVRTTNWVVHVESPLTDALAPLRARFEQAAVVGVLALLLAFLTGVWFARRLTAPIGILRGATRSMEHGEYQPGSLQIRSGDEFEDLAADFDVMALQLAESEARYRVTSELTSDFAYAYIVRADGSLVPEWSTDALTRITGYSLADVVERGSWQGLAHPDDAEIAALGRERLNSGRPYVNEFRILTRSGETRTLRIHARPVWDSELGRITHIFGAAQDITERKRVEEELIAARGEAEAAQRAEELKSEMIATVSHELRTPLTVLQGFSELLMMREVSAPLRTSWTGMIHTESLRLAQIIEDLLQVGRLENGVVPISLRPVEVANLSRDIVQRFAARPESLHSFVLECAEAELWASADHERLTQVLENLLSNAVKYSPAGGEVRVALHRVAETVEIAVSDQGLGIPEEELGKLFTRFHRVAANSRDTIRGTGLGLYITRQLVERQGGTIRVASKVGVGSTFTFTLAVATETTDLTEFLSSPDPSRQSVHA